MKYQAFHDSLSRYINLPLDAYQAFEEIVIVKKIENKEFLLREGETISIFVPGVTKSCEPTHFPSYF